MNGVIFGIAAVVWLGAAYAFVRMVMALVAVARLAPAGRGLSTALALGWWRYAEVTDVAGQQAVPEVDNYRFALKILGACLIAFFGLVLLNILSGNAA